MTCLPCPAGYILTAGHRGELAAALNRAILVHSGRREDSALEAIARQATAALAELKRGGHPAAQLLDVQAILQQGREPPPGGPS